ncbi:hypothetical protein I5I61_13190 [Pseudomonas nitroreducens]|uniref:Uncharacterized protein n=1 Tax=Pseudomonas nitroreducens TaxID=46680 RepID=A0ABS0KK00_PSENT|nr:hypothetical protein [Pseudomonas nitroreducens]MBG6288403.1 hypothetical protein [Pseudomonas nitroreducens]
MEMDLSIPGAKEERAKLKRLHQILNTSDLVPDQAYRMSSGLYPLVSFVNHCIGLYLSKNYDVIPLFLARAHSFMQERPPQSNATAYYKWVDAYMLQMAYVLRCFTGVAPELLDLHLPPELMEAGAQDIPE